MFAQLGSIPFQGLKGFTQFAEGRSTNIAQHARIEGKPRLQRVGSNLHELNVSILLHASFTNPETDFATLDEARETSEILPLVLKNGVYVGDYVITSIDRDILQTDALSNIVSMAVTMQLIESYNPSPLQSLATAAKQRAYSVLDTGKSPLRVIRPLPPTDGQAAVQNTIQIRMESERIPDYVRRAELNVSERQSLTAKLTESLTKITDNTQQLQFRLTNPAVNPFAGPLPTTLPGVLSAVNNLGAIMPLDTNIAEAAALAGALQNSVSVMTAAAAVLNNAVITRRI